MRHGHSDAKVRNNRHLRQLPLYVKTNRKAILERSTDEKAYANRGCHNSQRGFINTRIVI